LFCWVKQLVVFGDNYSGLAQHRPETISGSAGVLPHRIPVLFPAMLRKQLGKPYYLIRRSFVAPPSPLEKGKGALRMLWF